MRLDTVSAVVTGAAGGIGDPLCRRLVGSGARLLLVGRSAKTLGALARALEELPYPGAMTSGRERSGAVRDRIDVLAVDVTTASGRQAIRDAAAARHVNVLINAAAIASFGSLESIDELQLERVIRTDLIAPIALTRLLLPVLLAQPRAAIVDIGSALGSIGLPGFTVYGAAKAGLRRFNESLRRELAGSTVSVKYLGARSTRTAFNDARVEHFNRLTGTHSDAADDVARAAVALLASERSERFLGFPERWFARLNALVPTWIDGGFARHRAALARVSLTPIKVQPDAAAAIAAAAAPFHSAKEL